MTKKSMYKRMSKFKDMAIRCNICNRVLTDKNSQARGIGPDCAQKMAAGLKQHIDDDTKRPENPELAFEDLGRIWGIIAGLKNPETGYPLKCSCGRYIIDTGELGTYPHEGGVKIKGYDKKQWLYVHCRFCRHDTSFRHLEGLNVSDIELQEREIENGTV